MQAMVPVRHKFFDDYVLNSLDDIQRQQRSNPPPPLQFVNVACDLDARAFRLSWPQHTRVYEIDRPEVLQYKAGRLDTVGAISAPGSFVGADHPATRLAHSRFAERLMHKLQDMKAPLISSTDDPEGLLRSCGWDSPDVTFLGEKHAHYGRWPFPPVPAFIPPAFMPRFWLMTAKATR